MVFSIAASTVIVGATAAGGVAPRPRTAASPRAAVVRGVVTTTASSSSYYSSSSFSATWRPRWLAIRGIDARRQMAFRRSPAEDTAARRSTLTCATGIESTAAAASSTGGDGDGEVDFQALGKYVGATAGQTVLMIWLTMALDQALEHSSLDLVYQKAIVGAWFLFNALKSRTFSPLNASRPKVANEKNAIAERKRPSWMPPPLAFPIIWSTIALLRSASTVDIFTTAGTLNDPAVFAMIAHLAVGDTWNSINNVEQRLGTAVIGVACVLVSVYNVVFQYYNVSHNAGYLIAPSAVWISIATFLVYTIWQINPRPDGELEPLLPRKGGDV